MRKMTHYNTYNLYRIYVYLLEDIRVRERLKGEGYVRRGKGMLLKLFTPTCNMNIISGI